MSTESPHTLQKLAIQSLLRDKALAMEAVEHLSGALFPPVFMEAFTGGHTEVVKAMVLAWPFPYLPLGALRMREPDTSGTREDVIRLQERMLQAVLDGLDLLLSQVCSRTLKLRVLDTRVVHQNFWRVWAENKSESCSSEAMKKRKTEMSVPRVAKKQPLKVILDLSVYHGGLHPMASYFLKWVQQREDVVQVDCTKLRITGLCPEWLIEFLAKLNLDSVQELDVGHCWTFFEFAHFARFLGDMKNLDKLILSDISVPATISSEWREELFTEITSQLLKLHCLQEIFMDSVDFLKGHLDQVLRCLKCPLETLSLTHCQLSHSDWNQLPQAEQTRQLKHLDLSCIRLTHFSPEPLQILLDNVAATLTTLHLENCGITDAQVCALLPSLSCCSQLTTFCFVRNFISMDTMRKLLGHTARLRKLNVELYSVPTEGYFSRENVHLQMWNEEIPSGLKIRQLIEILLVAADHGIIHVALDLGFSIGVYAYGFTTPDIDIKVINIDTLSSAENGGAGALNQATDLTAGTIFAIISIPVPGLNIRHKVTVQNDESKS
ncbi:PREDICTED: PRAME family member 12-like [Chinchilla lanigera]|uniref:PRAME family member 12-like n=1 Tax=Chinchilla lanigera TaxID=34839 RepID=UPI0006975FDA|nr:PREDICTED: PRAME family member 12-like [Chinchilla lanigera]